MEPSSRLLASQARVLERIARGALLPDVLDLLTRACEDALPDALCSVLILDADTGTLHHGAAPRLSAAYCRAIDGLTIADGRGSCGTAAYRNELVIVDDIATHPYWADYRGLAESAGVRACWSDPIRSSKGDVLGTFAMYYRAPRAPDADDLEQLETWTHLAGVALERARIEAELNRHHEHLEELVRARTAELERANQELRAALDDVRALRAMLPMCAWCHRVRDDRGYWEQIEAYLAATSGAQVTHGICPDCAAKLRAPAQ